MRFLIPNILPDNFILKDKNQIIIPVENVALTVNYYKEYLCFKLINVSPRYGEMQYALMQFGNQNVLFEKATKTIECQDPKPKIQLILQLDEEQISHIYNELKLKTKIYKGIHRDEKGITRFSIQDCNGLILNFSACMDYQFESKF
jgi:hypothetical protein